VRTTCNLTRWSSAVGSTGLAAGSTGRRVAAGPVEFGGITPGRLVSELTVGRCLSISLGGTAGTAGVLDVDIIAVTAQSL